MSSLYKKLFWGFIIVFFDIKIGSFDILLNPVGYGLILSALITLNKRDQFLDVRIGTLLVGIMLISSIVILFIPSYIMSITIKDYVIIMLSMMINASIVFLVYKGSLRYVHHLKDVSIKRTLSNEGQQYAIISGIIILVLSTMMIIPYEYVNITVIVSVIVWFIIKVRFLRSLYKLSKKWLVYDIG